MVAEKYASQLKRIKRNVENSVSYFKSNNDRFHEFKRFVFKTQLSEDDIALLDTLQKPNLEFNILNAYISRLCGEFSKQEPSIKVMPTYGTAVDPTMIQTIEAHMRFILSESAKDATQYDAYKDSLAGGFSVFKVWTEYAHERSMDQVIRFGKAFEPTMCGFDPLARTPHKGDGQFCFEYYPYSKDEFKSEFPNVDLSRLEYAKENDGFNWAYKSDKNEVIVVCDYYEKKKKRMKLFSLANGVTLTEKEYEAELQKWMEEQRIEQPPAVVKERTTTIENVVRYRFIGNQVIDYKETDYQYLPLVFVDGDSIMLKDEEGSDYSQFTKPYIYHAKGAQRLKNFAGQTLANEIENMVMHKFMVAQQALPQQEDYLDAYTNIQQASVLVYNAFSNNDPDKPISAPQAVPRTNTPPEVTNAFSLTDQNVQTILGSYDAALGINNNQLSGVAIVEGATQSNSAAMPYVVNYMHALNQVAQIILNLIPKYIVTPRTIPVQNMDGKRGYVVVNDPRGIEDIQYEPNALSVRVEAGVNFEIQKNRALMQIEGMMQNSPMFSQFINENMDILLDNMSFRNVDIVRQRAEEWTQQMKQQRQQQAQQPNPDMLKQMNKQQELQQNAKKMDIEAILREKEYEIQQEKVNASKMETLVKAGDSLNNIKIENRKAEAEEQRTKAEMAIALGKHVHEITRDHRKMDIEEKKASKSRRD